MSLRINHNIASVNGHRNMVKNDAAISRSLEKLSSGLRINKAADDAAGLVISEQMRAQITGLNQAVDNSETAISMVQTAEGSLDEINSLLLKSRELVLHASNAGTNDVGQLLADQKELDNAIDSITRIAEQAQFGTKKLLDGSLAGAQGYNTANIHKFDVGTQLMARSDFKGDSVVTLDIVTAGAATILSGTAGAVVNAVDLALFMAGSGSALGFTAAGLAIDSVGSFLNTAENALAEGASLTITVSGIDYKFENQESVGDMISQVNAKQSSYTVATSVGTDLGLNATRTLLGATGAVTDLRVSAVQGYKESPTTKGVSGDTSIAQANASAIDAGTQTVAQLKGLRLGSDDAVTVNLVADLADASILRANAYGIEIDTTNDFAAGTGDTSFSLGRGALFQVGANSGQQVAVDLKGATAQQLGLGGDKRTTGRMDSVSSLKSTQALVNGDFAGALQVIDKAIDDVTNQRGQLGAFQANTLESGLNNLRVSTENLIAAESTIRDVDFAAESAAFTRNNILIQASTAMLAQANQLPQNVLQLLG
ncbi:MAG: hypothetical protein H0X45_01670 [Planctomycetes bacterium]|nr:hypothetical protein [Planctomycetota bacterium]